MALSSAPIYASIVVANIVLLLLRWRRQVKSLPPGPTKLPLIGNLFNMPRQLEAKKFLNMGKDYASDILHFEALGTSIVVLNSRKIAEDLLDKRSGIYSSRPVFTMFYHCGWGFEWIFWPYGERWRNARKMFAQGFSSPEVYQPREVKYVNSFLKKLLDDPEGYFGHIRGLPGSSALDMTYGAKIDSTSHTFFKLSEAAAVEASDIVGQTYLVELLPILKYVPQWFPGAGFQKKAAESRILAEKVLNRAFDDTEARMKSGAFEPAFVTNALESDNMSHEDRELLRRVSATVFLAASDTTTAVLGNFFLAMVLHPEAQKRVQEELDGLLHGTLPGHEDLDSLTYLEAAILEVLRWRTIVPLGVPHSLDADDIYEGYRIPAGSFVLPNQWAMLHDERDYPEPEKFRPERFIKDGKIDENVKSPLDLAFGFGRRTCPGRHIAMSTLMLAGASVLSTFNLNKKKDAQGNYLEPAGDFHGTSLQVPNEFPCAITPRSQQAVELIQSLADV